MRCANAWRAVALTGALSTFSGAARADCYDVFGCSDRDRFSAIERGNAATILSVEQAKGCPE